MIAEDVEEIDKNYVRYDEYGNLLTIDYPSLIPSMLRLIQHLVTKNNLLV